MSSSLSLSPFLFFYWDPSRNIFTIPWINHPVTWYGLLFAIGFFFAYLIVRKIVEIRLRPIDPTPSESATKLIDRLTLYAVIGTIVGARLAEVFFYAWPYYKEHPFDIIKIWEGGLASHGGILGVIVAIIAFRLSIKKQYPTLNWRVILDSVAIAGALTGACIRFGNFINQEILGVETKLPWGIVFGHPMDHVSLLPRHPVQLYESLFYFILFLFLATLWLLKKDKLREGIYSGLFFILLFIFRFFIEGLKLPQSEVVDESFLTMGQYLSLPFILFGFFLIFWPRKKFI